MATADGQFTSNSGIRVSIRAEKEEKRRSTIVLPSRPATALMDYCLATLTLRPGTGPKPWSYLATFNHANPLQCNWAAARQLTTSECPRRTFRRDVHPTLRLVKAVVLQSASAAAPFKHVLSFVGPGTICLMHFGVTAVPHEGSAPEPNSRRIVQSHPQPLGSAITELAIRLEVIFGQSSQTFTARAQHCKQPCKMQESGVA